jgi:phosphoadenosine phosphosulfate reductase
MISATPSTQTTPIQTHSWFPANYDSLSRRFERQHPREVIRWGLTVYGRDIAIATGFGPSGIVLMHLASQLRQDVTVFYLQTDLLFPETMDLRDRLAVRLRIHFTEVRTELSLDEQAQTYGTELWQSNPNLCCHLRKVEPLRRYLANKKAWVTAIRRDQSPTRATVRMVDWDGSNGLIKISPLAGWTRELVWAYLREHDLPYNSLHDQGYPSVGCFPCTSPVAQGASERSGRWAGTGKLECGIHVQTAGKIVRLANRENVLQ